VSVCGFVIALLHVSVLVLQHLTGGRWAVQADSW